jgi:hypothetical protein
MSDAARITVRHSGIPFEGAWVKSSHSNDNGNCVEAYTPPRWASRWYETPSSPMVGSSDFLGMSGSALCSPFATTPSSRPDPHSWAGPRVDDPAGAYT